MFGWLLEHVKVFCGWKPKIFPNMSKAMQNRTGGTYLQDNPQLEKRDVHRTKFCSTSVQGGDQIDSRNRNMLNKAFKAGTMR